MEEQGEQKRVGDTKTLHTVDQRTACKLIKNYGMFHLFPQLPRLFPGCQGT